MKRRAFVASTVGTGLMLSPLGAIVAAPALSKTPADYEGPYYPLGKRHRSNDLILGPARSDILNITGRLVTTENRGLSKHRVEIWQTDSLGRYRHPRDRKGGERWKDFLYWGESISNSEGSFSFRTYLPGAYGRRPAHIHYKIWNGDTLLLISQLYFRQTGGTQGASKQPQLRDLQTASLSLVKENLYECPLRIVI